jgi:apolipoprotein N-acyltransferase
VPLLIAFLAGLVSATGFRPLDLWPLLLVSLAALIALMDRATRLRTALAIAWCFGFGQFVLGLNWIATAFTFQAAMPAWLGWIAVVLLSLYLAVFPMLGAGAAWWATRRLGGGTVMLTVLTASAWIVSELARASVFTGFAWNPDGVVWIDLPTAQSARWIGTYGLSGLAVLTGGGLLLLGQRRWRSGAMLTAPLWLGVLALVLPIAPSPTDPGRRIRVVQPDIGQAVKYDPAHEEENVARLFRLSGKPGPLPRLLLWPEAAVPAYPETDPEARTALAGLLGPRDMLMFGATSLILKPDGYITAARNSLFGLDPASRLTGRYDKAHLVPYGEYLPMRPLLSAIGLSRLAPGNIDFLAGPGPRTLDVPGFGRIGAQICYEIVFSGHVVDQANRPDLLFNPSNDAWFGSWGPPQHLAQARLRAIEEAIPIVRATPTGVSAVIDTRGRLIASLPWRGGGAIETALPQAGIPTPFARYGNWLPIVFAILLAALAIALRRQAR